MRYAELAAAIRAVGHAAPPSGHLIADSRDVARALAAVFAADRLGLPVAVTDPLAPALDAARAPWPAGSWLVAVTSGTSGRPRPVVRTAESWASSFSPFTALTGITADDRILLTGPLHTTLHLFAAVHALAVGAEVTDELARATVVHAVPSALPALLDRLPSGHRLRLAVVAGSALPREVARRAAEHGVGLVEYYGAAELSFVAAARHPDPLHPFPGADVRLRSGEIWVRSPYLALGYAGRVSGPMRRDADGYATVGDLGAWTDGGGLVVRGRGDAAVSVGGVTVLAEDVEDELGRISGVRAVAVVGAPSGALGEVLVAVIEPDAGADPAGIRLAARRRLRRESLPRRWLVADELPRTASGKIARVAVAGAVARHLARAGADAADPSDRDAPSPDPGLVLRPIP